MKRRVALLMAGVLTTGMLWGCGNSSAADSGSTADSGEATEAAKADGASDGKKITIGFSGDYLSDFMSYVVDGVTDGCEENGITVSVQDAEFDTSKQLQQVENFINAGMDAVVIKPVDADACEPISQACIEAGVPLIVVNSPINADYDTYVGSDHKYSGQLQGEFVAEQLPDGGKVVILQGDLMNEATTARTEGAKEALAKGNNIEVVSEQEALWMRDEAMQKMENWLNSGMEIDAVIANNDEMAIGAAMVCEENGITDVIICGIDASEDALNMLKEGKLGMTVFQNGYQQGYQGIVAALSLINGETVEEYVDVAYETVLADQAEEYLDKIGK